MPETLRLYKTQSNQYTIHDNENWVIAWIVWSDTQDRWLFSPVMGTSFTFEQLRQIAGWVEAIEKTGG